MKYKDLMKELTAHPEKTYERGDWVAYMEDGVFTLKNRQSGLKVESAVDDDWQLVRQPVTWQEAIQAWACGSKVTVALSGDKYIFQGFTEPAFAKHVMNEGAWYVED